MKRFLVSVFLACATFNSINAEEKEVIIYSTKDTDDSSHRHSRAPSFIPHVSIDSYLLTFDNVCVDCTVEFIQDDELVFSAVVDENGEIQIPSYLIGILEIKFQLGSITFVGEIEL